MGLFAAILAGGGATRLWPLSRRSRPKWRLRDLDRHDAGPVIDALQPKNAPPAAAVRRQSGRNGQPHTLLSQALDRAQALAGEHVAVITASEQVDHVVEEFAGKKRAQILAEPMPRDTAGAVAFACAWALTQDADPDLIILPGDATLESNARFASLVKNGQALARTEHAIVTFGIKPKYPATGFGYILAGEAASCGQGCRTVRQFVEKPSRETALTYLKDGNYFWNAGIFLWRVRDVLKEFARQLPAHATAIEAMVPVLKAHPPGPDGRPDPAAQAELLPLFQSMTKISFDFGIMEHAAKVGVVPVELAWDDVGSYSALAAHIPENVQGNRSTQLTYTVDAEGCTVITGPTSMKKIVALVGVNDLTVVETPDALVVIKSQRDQDIKHVVERLREHGLLDFL
ncbi:MAG: mannose-1-phosphate guanylyltransferase [Planctomycetota bacterium]